MTTKGWKQRKHKRTSSNGKSFVAGSIKKETIPDLNIVRNITTAESLMKLDNFIWSYLGINSGDAFDKDLSLKLKYRKIIDAYAGKVNYDTAYQLENENYHQLLDALIATGHAKPFPSQYHSLKDLQEQYHSASEVADVRRLRYLWAKIIPLLKKFTDSINQIDEAEDLHRDMLSAAQAKQYDMIESIYNRMDGMVFLA
jgi:hypothetical protein